MLRPSLYTEETVREYVSKGCWEAKTSRYLCQQNTEERAGNEAVVDSRTRLSWGEVEEYTDRLVLSFLVVSFINTLSIGASYPQSPSP